MMSKEEGKCYKYLIYTNILILYFLSPHRQIALKALSERLKSTETSRHSQLPKSFPTVTGHSHGHGHGQHQHKHHGHHAGHSHHHGSGHSHGAAGHSHSHGHAAMGGHGELQTPPFLAQQTNTSASPSQPITTARSEPRMISTMSQIAIPMPAPPPKTENAAIASTDFNADAGNSDKALLIDMDNDNTTTQ